MVIKLISVIFALVAYLLLCSSFNVYAAQVIIEESETHSIKPIQLTANEPERALYTLNSTLLSLLEVFNQTPEKVEDKLARNYQNISQYNFAEQYLILLFQSKIKQRDNLHKQALTFLLQAKELSKFIDEQQLNTPMFSDLGLLLAESYKAINDFENAYHAKKEYIKKFNEYSDVKRNETIDSLTVKYDIAHKVAANKLLDNENKLKALELQEVNKKQENQQRNIILILCGIFVFILLFLRQFKIRKKVLLLSKTDSLTGLLNRAALFVKGKEIVEKSIVHHSEFSLLLFDIDHFKNINDDYGHQVGDAVLKEIANKVHESLRARDVFSRMGGEEFVVLLPKTDIDNAKAIAVRIVEKISAHSFASIGVKHPITLSIGVANIHDTSAEFEDILHAADLAMYQAKQRGRNQMVNYSTIAKAQERRDI